MKIKITIPLGIFFGEVEDECIITNDKITDSSVYWLHEENDENADGYYTTELSDLLSNFNYVIIQKIKKNYGEKENND